MPLWSVKGGTHRGGGARLRTRRGEASQLSTRSIVHWECHAAEHRALRSRHGNGGLTIHDGAWAYCDGAGSDDAHRWSATGGVPLESLVRWTAPNGAPAEVHAAAPVNGGGRTAQFAAAPTNGTAAKTTRKTPGVPRI